MESPRQTLRQQIMKLLENRRVQTHALAAMVCIPERQVEEHLRHIVKTVARDSTKKFYLDPAVCRNCRFVFRDRTRLTCPGRCPICKGESIIPPQYGIEYTSLH